MVEVPAQKASSPRVEILVLVILSAVALFVGPPTGTLGHAKTASADSIESSSIPRYLQAHWGYNSQDSQAFHQYQIEAAVFSSAVRNAHASVFAGAFFDHTRPPAPLILQVAGDDGEVEAAKDYVVNRSRTASFDTYTERVHWSQEALRSLMLDIHGVGETLRLEGRSEIVAAIDDLDNQIAVVLPDDISAAEFDEMLLDRRDGTYSKMTSAISYIELDGDVQSIDDCDNLSCDAPFRGGLFMNSQYDDGLCTSGFIFSGTNPNDYFSSTAGHCYLGGVTDFFHQTPSHGNQHVGSMAEHMHSNDGRTDAGRILVDRDYWGRGRNVYVLPHINYLAVQHSWNDPSALPLHTVIERAGGRSGTSGGSVRSRDAVRGRFTQQIVSNYCARGGDSGSPVIVRTSSSGVPQNTAISMHSGRASVPAWGPNESCPPDPSFPNDDDYLWAFSSHICHIEEDLDIRARDALRVPTGSGGC